MRPQTLVFILVGRHVRPDPIAVAASTFLTALERLDVSAEAGRSTLTRMVRRGFLDRHRVGRRSYLFVTDRGDRLLAQGEQRLLEKNPLGGTSVDEWTLLSFSIPERHRDDRHRLRVALGWLGFGLLRDGLWIAPGAVDVTDLVADLGLEGRIAVFVGRPTDPTNLAAVVAEAWDLDDVADSYKAFITRWEGSPPAGLSGPLAVETRLFAEWRDLVLGDPHVPRELLPAGWPAERAHQLFLTRTDELVEPARTEFLEILESIAVDW